MNALTENTIKLMEVRLVYRSLCSIAREPTPFFQHDTQLVSILYRTHRSLPSSNKVSSLYVIDAICRAARHRANKLHSSADSHSGKANSATFLSKFEAVLDGVIQDMLKHGGPEGKVSFLLRSSFRPFPAPAVVNLPRLDPGTAQTELCICRLTCRLAFTTIHGDLNVPIQASSIESVVPLNLAQECAVAVGHMMASTRDVKFPYFSESKCVKHRPD